MPRVCVNLFQSLVVLVVASFTLWSCGKAEPHVVVSKSPASVETRYVEDLPEGEESPLSEDEEALTDWEFGCKTEFEFDILEKSELADEILVTERIKKASLSLDAPIVVWLPKGAGEDLVRHEEAHVAICKRVYRGAEGIARSGADSVLKRDFQGSGKTLQAAIKDGLARASKQICSNYHLQMVEKINRISEVFDTLDRDNPNMDHKQLMELAFEKYSLIKD